MMETSTEEKVVDLKELSKEELVELAMERLEKQRHPFIVGSVLNFLTSNLDACQRKTMLDVCRLILRAQHISNFTIEGLIKRMPKLLEVEDDLANDQDILWDIGEDGKIIKADY